VKRKTMVLALTMILVLASSTFAAAANYIGAGLGIVGQAADGYEPAGPYIGTLALDFDIVDKLSISANGYLEVAKVEDEGEGVGVSALLDGYEFNYMVGAYLKYELFNLNGLGIGPVVGANYNSNFAPKGEVIEAAAPLPEGLKFGAGVYAIQPLGDTGSIYGQVMYWLPLGGEPDTTAALEMPAFVQNIGGLGGINFKLTEKVSVKGQIEYVNQHTLFSIGAGYTF
jgi:hypothetical protein